MRVTVETDVDIDVDDIIDEIDTSCLVAELKKRKEPITDSKPNRIVYTMPSYEVRTYLQDLFDANHTISDEDLIEIIRERLK